MIAGFLAWHGPVLAQTESKQLAMNLVFQRSLPSIVSITVRDHNGALRRGSGFFVRNNGVFITTFGVVENAHRITVRTEDGWLHPVDEVIALSKESNLALLRAPINKTRPLEIVAADANINIGEAAIAIAGTEGLQWHISYGQIVPPATPQDDKDTDKAKKKAQQDNKLHFSTPLLAGNQGGPLVNRYGRVMGVLLPRDTAKAKTATHTAIPAEDIHALLDRINVLPLTATWTANPPPKPKPPPLLSELDIEDDITEEDIPIVDRVEKELASALQAEEEARQ
ncbi:MAG: serine protease, partial [Salinisphaeraceae bacterium]|nr:serine protease [Salinisphaeraceae bacterium]